MVRRGPVIVAWKSHTSAFACQIADTQPCWPGSIGATDGSTRLTPAVAAACAGAAAPGARTSSADAAKRTKSRIPTVLTLDHHPVGPRDFLNIRATAHGRRRAC